MNNLPVAKEIFKEILNNPEKMFDLVRIDIKEVCEKAISELLKVELSNELKRGRYERVNNDPQKNYRNGSYMRRYTARSIGELNISVPRDRKGLFKSKLLKKYDRYEKSIEKDISLMFLSGLSTRGISLVSQSLLGRKISASEVSNVNKELLNGIDAWRSRSLKDLKIKYLIIDGVFFPMRVDRKVVQTPFLIVIGVTTDNQRVFLTIQGGDKDCASTWREIFKDMKLRGLDSSTVELGIMDGLSGLEKVFKEEFQNAKTQRCQVHVSRNVLCKVSKTHKKEVSDNLRDIFYAKDKKTALIRYDCFIKKYQNDFPGAVKSLENSIDSCLTFFSFPEEEWISLRTTNAIERVNKEFKRRTKPMEILAGEQSAYRLLCFVALKMELTWRSAPLGRNNLPILNKFTQNT